MGILSELTLVHMDAYTAIDRIERGIDRMARRRDDPELVNPELDHLITTGLRLRRRLDEFFRRERSELFPLVQRVFGDSFSEMDALVHTQQSVMESLDHFVLSLTEARDSEQQSETLRGDYFRSLLNDFIGAYEERSDAERRFYETHSSILFPGGVATE